MTPCPSQTSRRTRPARFIGQSGIIASDPRRVSAVASRWLAPSAVQDLAGACSCSVRCGRGMLRGRLNLRRGRNSSWRQRARCGGAVLECIQGQYPGGDRFGYPPTPGRIERPAARRAAEHLAFAATAAGRETPTAPKANEAVGVRVHPQGCRIDSWGARFGSRRRQCLSVTSAAVPGTSGTAHHHHRSDSSPVPGRRPAANDRTI